jgi:hypothetical protein
MQMCNYNLAQPIIVVLRTVFIHLVLGRGEAYTGFWWINLRLRDHLVDPVIDGRIILKYIFRK